MGRQRLPQIVLTLVTAVAGVALAAMPANAIVDKDCGDFASQKAAQIFFLKHGGPQSDPHGLDAEGDGIACESNPAPYYYGQSLPGGGGSPQPAPEPVRTSVTLALSVAKAITGERVRLAASVKPGGVRSVVFQRRVGSRWKSCARDASNRRGKAFLALRAPARSVQYRALVRPKKVGNKKFTAARSDARSLRILGQRVVLSFDDRSVVEGSTLRATAQATPARRGRSVSLQVRRQGLWETLRTSQQDRRGRVTFALPAGTKGDHDYRAVATRFRGAGAESSNTRTVTVSDVTPPEIPEGVVATASDGTVDLGWAGVSAPDLQHYRVFIRPDGGTEWTQAGQSTATALTVTLLTNGVTYWFTVVSVDTSGNASKPSQEVSATPTAPVTP